MSIYTYQPAGKLPGIKAPAGLVIEPSNCITQLSILSRTTAVEITERIAKGNRAYVAYIHNEPAAFGWVAYQTARIGELNHEFSLPEGHRYLWNFRTLEKFRGQGIYPMLLQHILQHEGDAARFWIIHAPENKASLNGICKAGFEYVGRLYIDKDDVATIMTSDVVIPLAQYLDEMDMTVSAETAATCWNCSSPYYKKRVAACCCAAEGAECIGDRLHNNIS